MRHFNKFYVCTTIPGAGAAVVGAAVVGGGGAVVGPAVVGAAVLGGGGAVVGAAVVGGSAVPKTNGMKNEIQLLPIRIFIIRNIIYMVIYVMNQILLEFYLRNNRQIGANCFQKMKSRSCNCHFHK